MIRHRIVALVLFLKEHQHIQFTVGPFRGKLCFVWQSSCAAVKHWYTNMTILLELHTETFTTSDWRPLIMPERELAASVCVSKTFTCNVLSPHNQFLNALLSVVINPKLEVWEISVLSIEPYRVGRLTETITSSTWLHETQCLWCFIFSKWTVCFSLGLSNEVRYLLNPLFN